VSLPHAPDALVIGGGVIGCAIARELAATRRVVLLDRGPLGGEASSAAAGVLGVASGDDDGPRLALRRASLARHPALAAALRDETDVDVGFARTGIVAMAADDDELAAYEARAARRRAEGYAAERLSADELHALEPLAHPDARGGVLYPDDAVVVAERLVAALADSARRRGAILVPGVHVREIERAGDRVVRVRAGDEWIAPGIVVVATGAWGASAIAGLDFVPRVVPVRGQMMALRPDRSPARVLTAGNAFLVPRPHGEVWVGATFEDAGFTKAVTPDGLRELAAHVARLAPALATAPLVRAWSGLRPSCPEGPIIGHAPGVANLLVALGHHRNGVLLAPISAEAVVACADGVPPPDATVPFLLG
jgi:glycine oxidase